MTSLQNVLSIAATALRTQQQALSVTAHNIANATTEGYSRQRAILTTNPSLQTPDGNFGMGVGVGDVQQVRDAFLDRIYNREASFASGFEARAGMLGRIEAVMGEPSEEGLAASLDAFYSAWSELGSNPVSTTIRSVVRQSAITLTGKLQELSASLDSIRQEVEDRVQASVDKANALATQIADINRQIVSSEGAGATAGDLRDIRNRAVGELAQLLPIQVWDQENGGINVTTSGISLLDGTTYVVLEARQVGGTWGIGVVGGSGLLPDQGGALGGYVDFLNIDLPASQQSLDDLAAALVAAVNTAHATGTNPLGVTGVSFFDPAGTTAFSIALSADILADVKAIAAGTPDGTGSYRAGENDIALLIGGQRDTDVPALGDTIPGHFQGLVSGIGQVLLSIMDSAQVHRTLADQADIQRMSYSGVAIDEELVRLIQFQTAYQAAAHMITAADEMMQSLLAAV